MKIQDILFLIVFVLIALKRDSKISTIAGLICLIVSIPLFAFWIFFTAEHLVYYSVGFFLLSIALLYKDK